jgi:hypothetical protein
MPPPYGRPQEPTRAGRIRLERQHLTILTSNYVTTSTSLNAIRGRDSRERLHSPRPVRSRRDITRRPPGRIPDDGRMEWTFTGEVIEWRGPASYLFVAMTPEDSEDLKEEARGLIYWGQVPVCVTIGDSEFTTALFPRDGRYLVPVKMAVQRAEAIGEGAVVEVALRLNAARRE